jgi:hypothetical protein
VPGVNRRKKDSSKKKESNGVKVWVALEKILIFDF